MYKEHLNPNVFSPAEITSIKNSKGKFRYYKEDLEMAPSIVVSGTADLIK